MPLTRFTFVIALLVAGAANAAEVKSYFPASGMGSFLAANFDVASIRSSLGPRRTPRQSTFAALRILPTKASEQAVEFDGATWYYGMRILRRGDLNSDGIEDIEVCFVDRAKQGTYDSEQALLITRYSDTTPAVAIAFEVSGCETYAR